MAEQEQSGCVAIITGKCSQPRVWKPKPNDYDANPAPRTVLDMTYMGGTAFVTLADPAQAGALRDGQLLVVRCPIRKLKSGIMLDPGTVVSINGKPV